MNDPLRTQAQHAGWLAFLYGYPLVESYRICLVQTGFLPDADPALVRAVNALFHIDRPATDRNRQVVTPANDLLYTTSWMDLSQGPCILTVPAPADHPGRYFVLALYDAWTDNFANPGSAASPAGGERIALVGPGGVGRERLDPALPVLQSDTDLVWMIGRILVGEGEQELHQARRLQAAIGLESLAGRPSTHVLASWAGDLSDDFKGVEAGQPSRAEPAVRAFLSNLQACLAQVPAEARDPCVMSQLAAVGLDLTTALDWDGLAPEARQGLVEGAAEAMQWLQAKAVMREEKPWTSSATLGAFGHDYCARAITAYVGIGALRRSEASYQVARMDAELQRLEGRHGYRMRFAPGQLPPAGAFWSVTLYAADRYLHPNALGRHALGDRSQSMSCDADGGLTLNIGSAPPASGQTGNWLPAPEGGFYLVLRVYRPLPAYEAWEAPPLLRGAT